MKPGPLRETAGHAPRSAAASSFRDGAQFVESLSAPLNLRFGPDSLPRLRAPRPVTYLA